MTVTSTSRLSLKQKLGYSVGDLGHTLFFQASLLYLIFFYTDIGGIPPAAVAMILLVARVIDAVANPIIGILADRTRTRWGRFRPYLLIGAIPLALSALAAFTTVSGSEAAKVTYAIVSYTIFSVCFASIAIPYSAMLGTITSNPSDRTGLGTLRAGFSFSSGIIVSLVTLPLVNMAGGGTTGFHVAIGFFGIIGVALLWITFSSTHEVVVPTKGQTASLKESLAGLKSKPLILFVVIFLISNISTMLRSAGAIYYFKYTLARPDLISAYLTFGSVMTVFGIAVTPVLVRWLDKRQVMILGLTLLAIGYIMTSFMPAGLVSTFIWLGFFPYFGYGLKAGTTWPILADCVDHIEWRTGKRVEGIAYGFVTFAQKLSLAMGGAITGWTLSATGYLPNAKQTALATHGILALVGFIPATLLVAAVLMAWMFPLTANFMSKINDDLGVRHRAASCEEEGIVTLDDRAPIKA